MSLGFCLNSKVSLRLGFLSIITNYKIADCVLNPVNYDFAATFYDFASKFPLLIFNDFAAFFNKFASKSLRICVYFWGWILRFFGYFVHNFVANVNIFAANYNKLKN